MSQVHLSAGVFPAVGTGVEVKWPSLPPDLGTTGLLFEDILKNRWEEELAPVVDMYMCRTLVRLGVFLQPGEVQCADSLIIRFGILSLYRVLCQRWLERLWRAGFLAKQGLFFSNKAPLPDLSTGSTLKIFREKFPQHTAVLNYIEKCGETLPEVLQGKLNPHQILFPEGSFEVAEAIYQNLPYTLYFNRLAGWVVSVLTGQIQSDQFLNIIEIGAGTGSTTGEILPVLEGRRVNYLYTDLSALFLVRGRQKFDKYAFTNYQVLDISQPVEGQGLLPASFDILIATNVLHATPNLAQTLANARNLLKPGGWVVINEVNEELAWFEITLALFEGWQLASQDPTRPGGFPLISAATWKELLTSKGFSDVTILPGPEFESRTVLRQHTLVARRIN